MWRLSPNTWKENPTFRTVQKKKERERVKLHNYNTWMSLWIWRPTISLEGTPEKTFSSSSSKNLLCPRQHRKKRRMNENQHCPSPCPSTWVFFRRGVISSTKVTEEAVLEGSVTEAGGITKTPFSMTPTVLFLMLEMGSFFLPLIFAYILWLNLVVIPEKNTF